MQVLHLFLHRHTARFHFQTGRRATLGLQIVDSGQARVVALAATGAVGAFARLLKNKVRKVRPLLLQKFGQITRCLLERRSGIQHGFGLQLAQREEWIATQLLQILVEPFGIVTVYLQSFDHGF